MEESIVLVSGGMDSCVTAALAYKNGYSLRFLHINYGQRTEQRELRAFHDIAEFYHVPNERRLIISIEHLAMIGGSSLTDLNMPVSKADLNSSLPPTSYVPFRNTHIIAVAVSWAEVVHATRILIGAVFEDSSGYPDCRPDYFTAFNELIRQGTVKKNIIIETPIIHLNKKEIIECGIKLNAPLSLTWSCYQEEEMACGVCDSCALRLRGFAMAGLNDPIPYQERPSYA